MENAVAVDLLRRKTYSDIEVNYWKNYAQKEVDFVLRKDRKVLSLIQVTYASSSIDIKDREINGPSYGIKRASLQRPSCHNLGL